MDFYTYKKGEFDPAKLLELTTYSDDVRRAANYKYPWARIQIADGVYCAITKWKGWERFLGNPKPLNETIADFKDYPRIPPDPSPSVGVREKFDKTSAIREYCETVAVGIGIPENEVSAMSLEFLTRLADISKLRVIRLNEFVSMLPDESGEEFIGVDAGDPAQFDSWCDMMQDKVAGGLGFPK